MTSDHSGPLAETGNLTLNSFIVITSLGKIHQNNNKFIIYSDYRILLNT